MTQIFRFKILHEELESFQRVIEIKSNQTFLDFNNIIRQTINLKGNELASFFICDNEWNKENEITLLDMSIDDNAKPVMSECTIDDFVEDLHQRLIYEYDFLNLITFYIELIDISKPVKKVSYPKCILNKGILPTNGSPKTNGNLEEDLLKEFNDLLVDEYIPDSDDAFIDDIETYDE
ncbi:MAG: plasmid pRiA4b ORF-3 family protein [Saprospiraceae bacterium]|nr:plasmid pRiA4b ORF-3 family protein [Saprospiraceae bacterium]